MGAAHITFTARIVKGRGRGQILGVPTVNLDLTDVPRSLAEGIYACRIRALQPTPAVRIPEFPRIDGVMHYGPRPVFSDSRSCEIHLIGPTSSAQCIDRWKSPENGRRAPSLTVEAVARIRAVENFASVEDLQRAIARDIRTARSILSDA